MTSEVRNWSPRSYHIIIWVRFPFPFVPLATDFPFFIFFVILTYFSDWFWSLELISFNPDRNIFYKKSGTNANFIYSVRFGAFQHRISHINCSRSYKTLKSSEKRRWICFTYWWFCNTYKKGNWQNFRERKTTIAS